MIGLGRGEDWSITKTGDVDLKHENNRPRRFGATPLSARRLPTEPMLLAILLVDEKVTLLAPCNLTTPSYEYAQYSSQQNRQER
jgi:hypothetical protein